jgi:hypothetical protein
MQLGASTEFDDGFLVDLWPVSISRMLPMDKDIVSKFHQLLDFEPQEQLAKISPSRLNRTQTRIHA